MKTPAQKIVERAAAELNAMGVTGYVITIKDPDSDKIRMRYGTDEQWAYGASEQLKVYFKVAWEKDANKNL